jgi:hypothetical protein
MALLRGAGLAPNALHAVILGVALATTQYHSCGGGYNTLSFQIEIHFFGYKLHNIRIFA